MYKQIWVLQYIVSLAMNSYNGNDLTNYRRDSLHSRRLNLMLFVSYV